MIFIAIVCPHAKFRAMKIEFPPKIIQGGMGVGVSGWFLAQSVAMLGQLGVVSGTTLDVMLARRLQLGDPGGHMERAMADFPDQEMAKRIWEKFFIAGGKKADQPFQTLPMHSLDSPRPLVELTVLGNFVEVSLAKAGHTGPIGINFLEKIQLPTLPSLYGAMLAGVDYVLMGAGIPRSIPGIIDGFTTGQAAKLRIDVEGAAPGEEFFTRFNPTEFWGGTPPTLARPNFVPIISSYTLALTMAKKASGSVEGFVVEGPLAGGHNAPPRGGVNLGPTGEPIYGERDVPDLAKIRDLGLPFWLAGSQATPEKLQEALALGAAGVQVGTAFALSHESGIDPALKRRVLAEVRAGRASVFTDPVASPTGFPFKVVPLPGSVMEPALYEARERVCDLGYLRHAYRRDDGSVGFRCPAEPVAQYTRKGGGTDETIGRVCLCNGLLATAGLAQTRHGETEPPLVTAGDDLVHLARFLRDDTDGYSAADVIHHLLG
jgi:NAD(P)H-dependent flavin oxidoreductase YrpB (nitropropane dioxygenase family)